MGTFSLWFNITNPYTQPVHVFSDPLLLSRTCPTIKIKQTLVHRPKLLQSNPGSFGNLGSFGTRSLGGSPCRLSYKTADAWQHLKTRRTHLSESGCCCWPDWPRVSSPYPECPQR